MSFDLAVWNSEEAMTDAQALEIYDRLCEDWPFLEGESANVEAFYQELIQKWPEIDTIPEDRVGEFDFCPWSCALNHSGGAVVMSCVWSKATDVAQEVGSLAYKHGLVLFDPQASRVILPEHLQEKLQSRHSESPRRSLFQRLFGR
ncbi:hypothetical protein [Occallatibacter savannae]|uniref:hypothetical protein n=1 Tax=Occallatibacter savannae TaxID=1002691 RepID=UPI000D687C68|nr:hypothetical protein [Occallatibacter savannae]